MMQRGSGDSRHHGLSNHERIPNSLNATWELRCGMNNRYRVFYDVDVDDWLVIVLAVGRKLGNRLMIGNEEIEL